MGNKKNADEDNTHLLLFKMKVMHDKECLLSCINLGRPGTTDSTAQLIILMGEKVQLTLTSWYNVQLQLNEDNKTHLVEF